jgi:hypothetical protein
MALFMEVHTGSVVGEVQTATSQRWKAPGARPSRFLRFWGNQADAVFRLVDAPSREPVGSFCQESQRPAGQIVVELPGFVG